MTKTVSVTICTLFIMLQTFAEASEQVNTKIEFGTLLYANHEKLKSIVNDGVDLNSFSSHGVNFISHIAYFRDSDTLRNWIELGATVDRLNENGSTLLFWAISGNRVGNVDVLLKHGANVNLRNKTGLTPLILAIRGLMIFNSPRIPIILIEAGADVNSLDEYGNSSLKILRQQTNYWGPYEKKIEKMLLRRGAIEISSFSTDSLNRDKNGQTIESIGPQQKRSKHKVRREDPECGKGSQYYRGENCELRR